MGTRTILLSLLIAGCLALIALTSPSAVAEDEPDRSPSGVWVFDVKVVRVFTTGYDVPETVGVWEPGGDGTTTKSWPEILKALKARGETRLLLDQRTTTVMDYRATIADTQNQQIKQYLNSDLQNERHGGSNLDSGTSVKLSPKAPNIVEYSVMAKWLLPQREGELRALLGTVTWNGTHPRLDGRTLVLTHRQQLETHTGARQGLELYALIAARYVP